MTMYQASRKYHRAPTLPHRRWTRGLFRVGHFCLLLRDFVEMVLTYRHDFAVTLKKCVVDRHHGTFLWIDYNIIDTVFSQQGRSVSVRRHRFCLISVSRGPESIPCVQM